MNQSNEELKIVPLMETNEDNSFELNNENSDNGLVFKDIYIPEEILTKILLYTDHKSLLKCKIVCKRWYFLIQSYVWQKKAESVWNNPPLPVDGQIHWIIYYYICGGLFGKNLLKNRKCITPYWYVMFSALGDWSLEISPIGVPPYPKDPIFETRKFCYVTSFFKCLKRKTINLVKEGYSEYLLDNVQPTVKISEWYKGPMDNEGAKYMCRVELIKVLYESGNRYNQEVEEILDSISFSRNFSESDHNEWFKFEHEFKNYGKGLRLIKFYHGGQNMSPHCGIKMGGTRITLDIPRKNKSNNSNIEVAQNEDKSIEIESEDESMEHESEEDESFEFETEEDENPSHESEEESLDHESEAESLGLESEEDRLRFEIEEDEIDESESEKDFSECESEEAMMMAIEENEHIGYLSDVLEYDTEEEKIADIFADNAENDTEGDIEENNDRLF